MNIPKESELNASTCRKISFIKKWPEFYNYLQQKFPHMILSEQLYMYYHNLTEIPTCSVCGSPVKFMNFKQGWRRTCSYKCAQLDNATRNKREQTCLERYGVKSVFQNNTVKEKAKQTCLKKYGVDNASKNEYIKAKAKQNYIKKYGGMWLASNKIKEKYKQTNLERYGVEWNSQIESIKKQKQNTFLKKYNGTGFASPILKEKTEQTNLERYGVKNTFQTPQAIAKQRKITSENTLNNNTNIINISEDYIYTCKCTHPDICNKCKEKFFKIKSSDYWNRKSHNTELCTTLFPIGSKESGVSNASKIYFEQLKQYFPDLITEYPLGKYKLDCYIPSLRIDIEYNGVYWHAKPTIYNSTDTLNFYGVYRTAQEIWDHDEERKHYIESNNIKVITLWEDNLPNPKELYKFISLLA